MKRLAFIGGLALAAAGLGLAGVGTATAAQPGAQGSGAGIPIGTYTIVFDGFCNTLTIVNPGAAGAPGVQAADSCGPYTLYGVSVGRGAAMVYEGTGTPSQVLVLSLNHTWTIYYDSTGTGVEGVFNSGTWSVVTGPSRGRSGLPNAAVSQGHSFTGGESAFAGVKTFPGPKSYNLDISFDGYCDGEHLTLPGAAGSPGIQGVRTGCVNYPLVGAGSPYVLGLSDYLDAIFYVINIDNTWLLYYDCGDGNECLGNSGTWSYGVPAAPSRNRTSVPSNQKH